jgi:hypothetical protein
MSADQKILLDITVVGGCGVTLELQCSEAMKNRLRTTDYHALGDEILSACFRNNTRSIARSWHSGHWDSHPDFPVSDWEYEVANGDTRLGYQQWVNDQIEMGEQA